MALNYAYNYAEVDDATGMCVGVMTSTNPDQAGPTTLGTTYVEIPVYDGEYLMKYYINGSWYEDPEGTIPWTSSLL
jgi:hypothetical protein